MWGYRIRSARLRRGLSQTELGALAGLSYYQVYCIEAGKVIPRIDVVLRIAKALDVAAHLLIEEEQAAA
ncbi:MAG: hypothetical protein BroJett004_08130 [Planctomycetota bacterium]|nr:MAG: hypothetical protein BroJett004_08130 [Planctomycetota bacterium]